MIKLDVKARGFDKFAENLRGLIAITGLVIALVRLSCFVDREIYKATGEWPKG